MRALAADAGAWMAVRKKINTKQRACKALPHKLWPKYYRYKLNRVPYGSQTTVCPDHWVPHTPPSRVGILHLNEGDRPSSRLLLYWRSLLAF
jgi:hypothetical protein